MHGGGVPTDAIESQIFGLEGTDGTAQRVWIGHKCVHAAVRQQDRVTGFKPHRCASRFAQQDRPASDEMELRASRRAEAQPERACGPGCGDIGRRSGATPSSSLDEIAHVGNGSRKGSGHWIRTIDQ